MIRSYHVWTSHVPHEGVTSRTNVWCNMWMCHEPLPTHGKSPLIAAQMIHVTYEWVTSHMNVSCHTWMCRVTYDWVMSHMNESRHVWLHHVAYGCIVSHEIHIWMCQEPRLILQKRPIISGSLKLQVSFAKEPYERDDILQKRPIIFINIWMCHEPQHEIHIWICQETWLAWHTHSHMKSHVPFERVLSRINKSWPIWM